MNYDNTGRLAHFGMARFGGVVGKRRGGLPVFSLAAALMLAGSVPVQAQTFANIPALSFVKHFAGPNPLPQTITVASTGSPFNFSASVSTSSGGNWLVIAGLSCGGSCGTTARSLTVSVNPDAALAAGTYTGQITFNSGSLKMVVPVGLSIKPAGTAHLEDVPGGLSFSLATNAANPPNQSFAIHSTGAGPLNWNLSVSTADGKSWLSVPVKSGVTPATITAGVQISALPGGGKTAGTFMGQIVLLTAAGNVTIPVTVTVGSSVFEQLNPINFSKSFGGADPLPQVLTVASTGDNINFSASWATGNAGGWLSISGLACGNTCGTTPRPMTVSISTSAALAPGIYTGEIVINSGAVGMTVPVTLTVVPNPQPSFDNLPGQISFSLKPGGAAPAAQSVSIRSTGSGSLSWTLAGSTSDGGAWLSVSAGSGNTPSTVAVEIDPNALPNQGLVAGTFLGQLLLRTAGDAVTIPVSVTIGDSVFEQTNSINFTKPQGGANPLPQVLTIASTGTAINFSATWSTSNGGNWLAVSGLACGNTCGTTPRTITVSVNPSASLAAGIYTGEIILTSGSMAMTIPVTLAVAAGGQPFFDNLPGQMSFSLKTGGAAPPAQSLQIQNAGSGTLNWTLIGSTSDRGAWLTLSSSSGLAPSTVEISINPSALPNQGLVAGTFTGQLLFRAGNNVVTVPVSVAVADSVFEQTDAVSFTKAFAGANPLPQILTIASTGAAISYSASWSTGNGGNWLLVSGLACGNTCGTTPQVLTVSVNPSTSLTAGTYTGEIVLTSGSMAMTVPVLLTIAPGGQPFFDNLPGQMSFSLLTGAAAPPAQSLRVRNAGSGTLNWTLSTSTSDGGAWLAASATSGIAPSTPTITINKNSLPNQGLVAGTFTGQLVFRTNGDSVTVPVSVVVGSVIFQQLPAIVFSKTSGGSNPAPKAISITSLGHAISFSAAWSSGRGGNWLSVTGLGCGNVCGSTPQSLTVSVNSDGLADGTYTGQIVFSSGAMAMTVPVYLTIASPPKPTTTSLISSANPSGLGQAVTFTSTVSGSGATITGNVTFKDGSTALASVALINRVASFSTSTLGLGTHLITATYGGDLNNLGSTSAVLSQMVQSRTPTTTTLTSSVDPSISGTAVLFVAKVGGSGSVPTGTVAFKDGGAILGTVSLVNGTASMQTSTLAAGVSHTITAVYSGDTRFGGSTSAALFQRVLHASGTMLSASANPSTFGQFVALTAKVTAPGTGLTGFVTFLDGATPLSTVQVNGNVAVLVLSNLAKGTHSITGFYGGNPFYAGSLSPALSQVVK